MKNYMFTNQEPFVFLGYLYEERDDNDYVEIYFDLDAKAFYAIKKGMVESDIYDSIDELINDLNNEKVRWAE